MLDDVNIYPRRGKEEKKSVTLLLGYTIYFIIFSFMNTWRCDSEIEHKSE